MSEKPKPLHLNVKTNGTLEGTTVTDLDGRPLTINSISFKIDGLTHRPTVVLEIPNVQVDFQTQRDVNEQPNKS